MAGSFKVCWNNPTEQGEGVPDQTELENSAIQSSITST